MAAAALALAEELSRKTGLRCAAVVGDGAYAVEIVGGARYQKALEGLAGGRNARGGSHKCMALLVPELANPRDPGAVLVQISGHDVGYLGRDLGPVCCRELAAAGCSAAIAAAVVVGGWNRLGGAEGRFGVKLDLVHPLRFEEAGDRVAAAGPAPSAHHVDSEAAARPSMPATARLVASRFGDVAASFLAGVGTRGLALAAAIFIAGMATGAGLIILLRPPMAQAVPLVSAMPAEPGAKAEAGSPIETAAPIVVPLPRLRPAPSPDSASTTGQ